MSLSDRSSSLAVASIAIPVPVVLIGFLYASTAPLSQGDWLGMGRVVPAFLCLFGAAVLGFLERVPQVQVVGYKWKVG